MMRALILLAALAWPASALAQSADDLYRSGVEARLAGDGARAVELLSRAVAAQPDNADAHLQLGLALLAEGRLDEAEAALRRTLEIAPDYADARIALARLAERRGHRAGAPAELDRINGANAEADTLRVRLAVPTPQRPRPRWRLDIDGSYSDVEGNQPDWREGTVALRYQASPATSVAGRLEVARRFGRTDTYGEARVDHRFSDAVSGYLLFGATPEADFRPEWQIGAGGSIRVRDGGSGTVLQLDLRQARYPTGDIQTVNPGIEQYLAGGRIWFTGRWINIFDEEGDHQSGWLARGDVLATERLRLFAGLADAPDTSEGVVIETFSVFGGLSWDMDERTTLRLSLAHEDRESGSDRTTFGLGLGFGF